MLTAWSLDGRWASGIVSKAWAATKFFTSTILAERNCSLSSSVNRFSLTSTARFFMFCTK